MSQRLLALLGALAVVAASIALRLLVWAGASLVIASPVARSLLTGGVVLLAIFVATIALERWRPAAKAGRFVLAPAPRQALMPGGVALLLGAALFAAVYAIARLTGGIVAAHPALGAGAFAYQALIVLVATIFGAAWEEYTFRGWPFVAAARALGEHGVAWTLGVVFGLAHFFNPKWTPAAIVSIAFAGVLICYTMLLTRNIAAPTGLHVGWNYAQSLLTSSRFWTVQWAADTRLSGGRYRLEASWGGIAMTTAAMLAALALYVRSRALSERCARRSAGSGACPP